MSEEDIPIGPAGGCATCYHRPCICRETPTERTDRQRREKRLKAHGEAVEMMLCDQCGKPAVVADRIVRAFVCLDCGAVQKPYEVGEEGRDD